MREILFRGKRIDNGEWVEGLLSQTTVIASNKPAYVALTIDELVKKPFDGCWHEVDPETVAQFTGLTDMNGKKIFEGDILNSPSWWWGPRFVYLMQGKCGPCHGENVMQYILAKNVDNPESNATWNLWDGCQVEVIGNIHDNPELLTEKEE